jgi:hypothetical protein
VRVGQSYDDFFEFEFRVLKERLSASVNGSVVIEADDSTLRHGLPGVSAYRGASIFKDIEIRVW